MKRAPRDKVVDRVLCLPFLMPTAEQLAGALVRAIDAKRFSDAYVVLSALRVQVDGLRVAEAARAARRVASRRRS